jgi:hypothetical protein
MLGMVCLIAALTAAQLFPFLDFLAHSQRGSGYADTKMYALPLMGWANYLTPPFQCVRTPYGLFLQAGQGWTASYYVGAGTVALALLAVWRVRTYRVRLLAALALFSLLMALGGNGFLYDWIKGAIPMLGFLRYPMKFIMLATLVIPLLAACGLSWLQALPEAGWPSEWKRACGVALGLLALMAFILADAWKHPVPGSDPIATARNTLVRAIFLALIFGCLALLHREKDFRFQRWLQAGLIVLVWFDLFTHAPNLSPTAAQSVYEPDAIRRFFHWDQQLLPGTSRALQSRSSFWRMCYENGADAEVNVTGHRLSLFMNFNLLDHAAKFDGFFPLNLKEFNELYNIVNFGTNQTDNLQDFLAISHISNPTNDVDWVTRSSALPMITAGQQPIFADRASTFRAVTSAVFDPPREVYLPPEASPNVDAIATGAAKIVASRFTAQKLEIDVATPVPAMVVIAQTFCHPWHAYVDGKRTALWRANYAFQALEVPAGQHHVRLVYEDTVFHCGVAVSLASLLAIGLLFFKWK